MAHVQGESLKANAAAGLQRARRSLNKFHTATPAIQALWLIAVPVTAVGVSWVLMRGLRDIAVALIEWRCAALGRAVHVIHETPDGRFRLYIGAEVQELPSGEGDSGIPALPAPARH